MAFVYRTFLKGLLTLLPITLTVYLLVWVLTSAEGMLGAPLRAYLPPALNFPGIGVALCLIFIFVIGLLVNHYLTNKLFHWLNARLESLPVVRSIYSPLRDVTNLFARQGSGGTNQKVVFVNVGGIEMMGLVTRDRFDDLPPDAKPNAGEEHFAVFIPFSYGMGGFTIVAPRSKIRETSLPADRAMQLAITGWIKSSK